MKTPVIPISDHLHAKHLFLTDVPVRYVLLPSGHDVATQPFKAGVQVDLIGISHSDELFVGRLIDNTDELDADLRIDAVFIEGLEMELLEIDVSCYPDAQFKPADKGNCRDLELSFDFNFKGNLIKVRGLANSETGCLIVTGDLLGYTVKGFRSNSNRR